MSLKILRESLVSLGVPVYHYTAPSNTKPDYIVWAEDSGEDFTAGNQHTEYAVSGSIDLYIMDEDSPLWRKINDILNAVMLSWYYNSTQYDEETGIIHREWVFTCGVLDDERNG